MGKIAVIRTNRLLREAVTGAVNGRGKTSEGTPFNGLDG
jgi:hypothetical protein